MSIPELSNGSEDVARDTPRRRLEDHAVDFDAWRSDRHRLEKRTRALDWIMVFVDEVQAATTAAMTHNALRVHAQQLLSVYEAITYIRDEGTAFLHPTHDADKPNPPRLPAVALSRLDTISVLSDVEAREDGTRPHAWLAPVFTAFGAAQLACASVGDNALLVLIERRRNRVFTAADRDMLGWIVRQAERRLKQRA